jgi:hypothetical protein
MNAVKRALTSAAILVILTCGARPAQAASIPFINVNAFGLELCPQSICGAAIFVGLLQGQVGLNPNAVGTFAVAVTHTDLPTTENPFTVLTGGSFDFRFFLRRIRGSVVPGGFLFEVVPNKFIAVAELQPDDSDRLLDAMILLDHTTFPPTVTASVASQ